MLYGNVVKTSWVLANADGCPDQSCQQCRYMCWCHDGADKFPVISESLNSWGRSERDSLLVMFTNCQGREVLSNDDPAEVLSCPTKHTRCTVSLALWETLLTLKQLCGLSAFFGLLFNADCVQIMKMGVFLGKAQRNLWPGQELLFCYWCTEFVWSLRVKLLLSKARYGLQEKPGVVSEVVDLGTN